ncbi:MAG: Glu-tRNA(Gln) amidotransferase subunit GatD [Candidatus Marsarchaeota archaeon]|nr:Glu-tRNA(Gln) amidotransferase subunit GatD [Candidatus Marsarchaeota archaeon]
MYSDSLREEFRKAGVKEGDTVRVTIDGLSLEGELMPKPEIGSGSTLILKLKNGYNVGMIYGKGSKIERLKTGSSDISFPKASIKPSKGLPRVLILYTGGTIGSRVDYKTGGVYMLTKPEELLHSVPEISEVASIDVKHLFSIASEDITYIEWQQIAKAIAEAAKDGYHGVVVTIGTDTMHYTSSALSFMLKGINMPVVLTGAQRSSDRGSSDAFLNLLSAVSIAAKSDAAEVGICMHRSSSDNECIFIRGTKVRKMHTSRRDAFRPINDSPLLLVKNGTEIEKLSDYRTVNEKVRAPAPSVKGGFEKKVAIVKLYPNSDPGVIGYYVDKGYKGIILEGTGLGHGPVSTDHKEFLWLPAIEKAVKDGVVVGMTSQCIYGRVHPSVYRNLRLLSNAGVIFCEDMTPETAYVKLAWLLGNYTPAETREMLPENLVGEIKSRILYREFMN